MMKRLLLIIGLLSTSGMLFAGPPAVGLSDAEKACIERIRKAAALGSDPSLTAMNALRKRAQDPLKKAQFDQEIRQILVELKNDPDSNPANFLAELNRDLGIGAKVESADELDWIKWQNTLLTSPNSSVGLYKRDFIESGLLAADIYADVQLYNALTKRRIEHIMVALLDDTDGMIDVLKQVIDSAARYEERMSNMSTFAQMFANHVRSRNILLNPLRRYLDEHHVLIKGINPFNRITLVPLLARWGWEKASSWIENKLIAKPAWQKQGSVTDMLTQSQFFPKFEAHRSAYQSNPEGDLYEVSRDLDNPVGVTTGLIGLTSLITLNPFRGLRKYVARYGYEDASLQRLLGNISWVNRFGGLGIPNFLFTKTAKLGLEVLGIGFSAKCYDAINNTRWKNFVIQHREKLLRKLLAYRRALAHASSGEDKVMKAKQSLRKLVEEGHNSSGWIPGTALSEWWATREEGKKSIQNALYYGAAALVSLKLGHWWLTRNQEQQVT